MERKRAAEMWQWSMYNRNGRRLRDRIAASALISLAAACAAGGCAGNGDSVKLSASTKDLTADYRGSGAGITQEADVGNVNTEFAQSYLDFSIELLRQSRSGQNVMVSPASVLLALEMTRCGARGETLAEMNEVLYPGITPEQGKQGSMALRELLDGESGGRDAALSVADSVWIHTGDVLVPEEEFLRTVATDYDAQIYGAPFDETTLQDINCWVEEKTDGRIRDILEEIPEDAMLYLINTVAYEGEWEEPYEAGQVHDAVFYGQDGNQTTVPMMYSGESRYLSGENVQGFVKPYRDGCRFVALLPDPDVTLEEYLAGLDGEELLALLLSEEDSYVEAGLPKFENDTRIELADILAGMGMPSAFASETADFTGMGYCADGRNLYISRVLHQTYVCVDEQGTKAAAATIVEMDAGAGMPSGERVILDRPFLYMIVEESGLPVFFGTVESF